MEKMAVDTLKSLNVAGAIGLLAGPSSEVSPVHAIFLLHRALASGRLWMTRGLSLHSIDFHDGLIVGCSGFVELGDRLTGERHFSINEWASLVPEEASVDCDALVVISRALCGAALKAEQDGDWMVNFVEGGASSVSGNIGETPTASLGTVIRERVSVDEVRTWFERAAIPGLAADVPSDCERTALGLNPSEQRLLSCVENDGSVGSLFMEIGSDGWGDLGVLWRLGLIRIASADDGAAEKEVASDSTPEPFESMGPEPDSEELEEQLSEEAAELPSERERRRSERRTATTSRDVPKRPTEERRKRDRRSSSGEARKRDSKRRRLDPRRVALKRAPFESPPELMEQHLDEAHAALKSVSPEFMFRLRKEEHLAREAIEQRYHKMVTRYHPDRYRTHSQSVKVLAEACFTAVSDAFHCLKDPAYMSELRIRIIEKETGKKVITDKTRATAKVDFAKADALFKQKRFDEARTLAQRAQEGDPDRWQYAYLALRAGYRSGLLPIGEVEPGILSLQGMTTVEKADQLYTLGEMMLKEGDEKKAYKLFHQAVSLDERNVGANRRLRLKDRRQREQDKSSSGGLFGGLFRGKRG